MSVTAAAGVGLSLAAVMAIAAAYGISTSNTNSMSDFDLKNDLIKKIEIKSGKPIQEVEQGYWNGVGSHIVDTSESDKTEKKRANDLANANADKWAQNHDIGMYLPQAETMTEAATGQPNSGNDEEENKDLAINPGIPNIQDTTNNNIETNVEQTWNLDDIKKYMEEAQAKQWEREDAIRKETQEREDTAYQRAVADMRKAGINPNLINVNPANSGGGITQATGMDMSTLTARMTAASNELIKILDREFNEDENTKDNITNLISGLINAYGMYMTFAKGKGTTKTTTKGG